jgi:hypothetical protein
VGRAVSGRVGGAAATQKARCYVMVNAKVLPCGLGATAGDAEASRQGRRLQGGTKEASS